MPTVSLTEFADFIVKSGPPRSTHVKTVATRGPYDPKTDFWKILRDGIQDYHTKGNGKSSLDKLAAELKDPKKINRYPAAIKAYKKFLGKKATKWFKPTSAIWASGDLQVRINPELGLEIDGKKYIIKLYFKGESLTKSKSTLILALMTSSLKITGGETLALLDVPKCKLILGTPVTAEVTALLEAEALAFVHIWNKFAPKASAAK